jgi:1-acyl-sn-glycerol-3-phosphate acyltransferase
MKIYHPENIPDSSPYFIISAHRNYFDPFFISYTLPHMVKHICTYEMFRGRIKSAIFKLMGAIPKKRYKTDQQSNRLLIKALIDGYAIGLFPEGGRSWTGEMRSLKPETLRLLQHYYKIPILPVRLEGNYHSWPRWSNGLLKADLKVVFGEPFSLNPGMELEEINSILKSKICNRPEIEETITCRSKNRIGKLSIVIYRCPNCNAIEALKEIPPDNLLCNSCKKLFVLQPDLKLTYSIDNESHTESIHSIYQKIKIRESDLGKLSGKLTRPSDSPVISNAETLIYISTGQYWDEKGSTFKLTMIGEILLTNQRILITSGENEFTLNLMDIDAVTIESNYKLQIYQEKTDHLIQILFQSSSALLWQDLLVLMLEKSFSKKVITR